MAIDPINLRLISNLFGLILSNKETGWAGSMSIVKLKKKINNNLPFLADKKFDERH